MITRSQQVRAGAAEIPLMPSLEADKASPKRTRGGSSAVRKRRKVVVEPAVAEQNISRDDNISLVNLPDRTKEDATPDAGFHAVAGVPISIDTQDQTTNVGAIEEEKQSTELVEDTMMALQKEGAGD